MATKKSIIKKTIAPKKNTTTKYVVANKIQSIKKEEVNPSIFPIGKFVRPEIYTENSINELIVDIQQLPKLLKHISKKIKHKKQLFYSYRDGGWSIEQIFHHIADSHLNAFVRFKLALTENNPTIKPYNQDLWTETADQQLPIKTAIQLTSAIHKKWVALLENMDNNDFKRTFFHPEHQTTSTLQDTLALYAWHGKHHVAQIKVALKNKPKKEKNS